MYQRQKQNRKVLIIASVIALVAAVVLTVVIVAAVVVSNNQQPVVDQEQSIFKLHVNPADPVILSAETPEGDVIYMLGNKSADSGAPLSVDEFQVENEDGTTTYVTMNEDGTIGSAQDTTGMQIDFIDWDENQTTVYLSLVFNNGSEQLTISVNFSEPLGENFTDQEETFESESKRSLQDTTFSDMRVDQSTSARLRMKRQSSTQTYASTFVSVETCNEPEQNARVFADVLIGYNQQSGSFESSTQYQAMTAGNGEYEVRIPTSPVSDIGEKSKEICDSIEMVLSNICDYYSKANDITKYLFERDFETVFCFLVRNGLRIAFPQLRLVPLNRLCRNIFKPLNWYCNNVNKDIPSTDTSVAELICDSLPIIDNGVDFFNRQTICFTPSAVFPQGNLVKGNSRVLSIPPGTSRVSEIFTVANDRTQLKIDAFSVTPFDPAPRQSYVVTVSYSCFSASSLTVRMSIIGTDGYSDVVTCSFGSSCTLHVPGADALVRDDVDVSISDENSSILRKVVVIF